LGIMEKVVKTVVDSNQKGSAPTAPKPQPQPKQQQPAVPQPSGVLKKFSPPKAKKGNLLMVVIALLVVGAGVGTGWLLSGQSFFGGGSSGPSGGAAPGAEKSETEAGLEDESTFRDSAEGKLVEGGIEGEGTHHLEREGGEDQNVYLTSTVIDLSSFVGKKVKIWGETIAGQKAGWLMDVGKVKVVE
jgi:hypothetical protein